LVKKQLSYWLILLSAIIFCPMVVLAASDSGNTNFSITTYTCNHNGTCDAGETSISCPDDCTGGCSNCGGNPFTISGVAVSNITYNSSTVSWTTSNTGLCQVSWGVTTDYLGGSLSEVAYSISHSSALTGLLSNTQYYFKLVCNDQNGNSATSLNNTFTTLSAPDLIPPGNVIGLRSVPGDTIITLFWQNPADPDLAGVRIRRSTVFYPTYDDGVLVYDGLGNPVGSEVSFEDTGLTNGVLYYYSLFAYDTSGNHASGVGISDRPIGSTTTPPIEPPPVEPPTEPGVTTTPPEIIPGQQDLLFKDFNFFQQEQNLAISYDDVVAMSEELGTTVTLPAVKVLPQTDRMMLNLSWNGSLQSYFFVKNSDGSFSTNLPNLAAGRYPATIVVLDENGQTVKTVSGWLETRPKDTEQPAVAAILTDNYQAIRKLIDSPAGKGVAAAIVALALINVALATPWWNLWYLMQFIFSQPFQLLRKRKGWGVVYNSITKQPIDLALIRLYDAKTNRLLGSRVTDKYGRYIFLVEAGSYYMKAEKPGLEFPSVLLKNRPDDGNYLDLYYGKEIVVDFGERAAIVANIPLDQKDISITDNEAIRKFSHQRLYRQISWVGPIVAAVYAVIFPSVLTISLLALHLFLLWYFWRLAVKRSGGSWGVVFDKSDHRPLKKAVTRIFSSEYGRMLEFYVTDSYGRYDFLVGNNKYYVTADKDGYVTTKTPVLDLADPKLAKQKSITSDIGLVKENMAAIDDSSKSAEAIPEATESEIKQELADNKAKIEESTETPEAAMKQPEIEERIEEVKVPERLPVTEEVKTPEVKIKAPANFDMGSIDEIRENLKIETMPEGPIDTSVESKPNDNDTSAK
jgi:hypothetical protein